MYNNHVPVYLHQQAEQFITDLQNLTQKTPDCCPYCQFWDFYSVDKNSIYFRCKSCKKGFNAITLTSFHRLTPLNWLPSIAEHMLMGTSEQAIAGILGCTINKVKRREVAIKAVMKNDYPSLYRWWRAALISSNEVLPSDVEKEYDELSSWVKQKLNPSLVVCNYCQSNNVVKIGQNSGYRCRSCRKYFNPLKGSGLELLRQQINQWKPFLLCLVSGNSNMELQQRFQISSNIAIRHRRIWLYIMHQQGFLVLREWIMTTPNKRFLSAKAVKDVTSTSIEE